jgi:ElaB/YqjD/DUF883 family membrane-anchored ribosome-binding protein
LSGSPLLDELSTKEFFMSRTNESATSEQSTAAQIRDKAAEMAGAVKEAATEQYERVRDTAEEFYESGRDKARQWEQGIEEYVQEKPIKALLIAAGVGMVLGILWKRH